MPLINWIQRGLLANVLILTGCCVLWVELGLFGAGGRESRVVAFGTGRSEVTIDTALRDLCSPPFERRQSCSF